MDYAAARHLVPPPGDVDGVSLPWEMDSEVSPAHQETWLLSFIDILALLLTLFVLLLAYQDRGPAEPGSAANAVEGSSLSIDFSLQALNRVNAAPINMQPEVATGAIGYSMPGEGLLPREVDAVHHRAKMVEVAVSEPVARERPLPATAGEKNNRAVTVAAAGVEPVRVEPADEQTVEASSIDVEQPQPVQPGSADAPVRADAGAQSPQTAADQLLATLNQTVLGDRVEMTVHRGVVSLDISDSILFSPASAALSGEGLAVLNELAVVLQSLAYRLSVEGHTDNVPIQTARFPSNWELSSARAARVTRKLIEQGVAPDRVRAIGYGDTRPRSDNDSSEGRAKNRRVTFVLQLDAEPVGVPATR